MSPAARTASLATRSPIVAARRRAREAARHRRALGYWLVLLGLLASLWIGVTWEPPAWLYVPALFPHLAAVIVGLGAAVFVDLFGLAWSAGRITLADLRRLVAPVHALIWITVVVLLVTGSALHPDPSRPLTALKLVAVGVVALNGVAMWRMQDELDRVSGSLPFARLPLQMRIWCVWSAMVSQAGWWTAVLIGLLNTAGH